MFSQIITLLLSAPLLAIEALNKVREDAGEEAAHSVQQVMDGAKSPNDVPVELQEKATSALSDMLSVHGNLDPMASLRTPVLDALKNAPANVKVLGDKALAWAKDIWSGMGVNAGEDYGIPTNEYDLARYLQDRAQPRFSDKQCAMYRKLFQDSMRVIKYLGGDNVTNKTEVISNSYSYPAAAALKLSGIIGEICGWIYEEHPDWPMTPLDETKWQHEPDQEVIGGTETRGTMSNAYDSISGWIKNWFKPFEDELNINL